MYASTSPYAYCGNDPVNFTDFAGLTRTYNYATGQWEGTRGQDLGYFTGGLGGSSGGAGSSPVPIGGAGLQEAGPKPTNKQLDDYIAACNNPYAPFKGSLSDYIALTESPEKLGGVLLHTHDENYIKSICFMYNNQKNKSTNNLTASTSSTAPAPNTIDPKYPGIEIYYVPGINFGITLPPYGIFVSVDATERLKEHEYGHFLQYNFFGKNVYYEYIAKESAYNYHKFITLNGDEYWDLVIKYRFSIFA